MTSEQKIIKNKVGLLKLAQTLGSVSEACKVMGFSRDSFYRFKELHDQGGEAARHELPRIPMLAEIRRAARAVHQHDRAERPRPVRRHIQRRRNRRRLSAAAGQAVEGNLLLVDLRSPDGTPGQERLVA